MQITSRVWSILRHTGLQAAAKCFQAAAGNCSRGKRWALWPQVYSKCINLKA